MRLGIFAKTFPGVTPGAVLEAARGSGFACVQYNMACSGLAAMPEAISDAQAGAVSEAARAAGVAITAVSGTWNMIHPDAAVRAAGQRRLAVLAAAAGAMGTRVITLCTGTRDTADQWRHHPDNGSPEAWRDLLEEMAKACAIAEAYGLRLGIEPELANVISSAAKARLLIDTLASPTLGIVLDPANLFELAGLQEQRDIVSAAIDLLGDRIVMGHAKDRDAQGGFVAAGTGILDFSHYINVLRHSGFDGDLITHGLDLSEVSGVAEFLHDILAAP